MLEHIQSREDLLALTKEEDQLLCNEIREFLIQHVAQTGGHLASNLGVVELTLALHKVYDTSKDRLLFDVGHQSYVHKILTGRAEQFDSLRTLGGLAGFPKPSESRHDAFIAGHASDAVSVALGMARARSLRGDSYQVVTVLGDGALTGGLAYEGLNDAGQSGEALVVVLNDNGMSINTNVGAMAKHLSLLRLKPGYFGLKKAYRQITSRVPGGHLLYLATHRVKTWLRKKLIGVTLFEEMGFQYLGPVDGHDVEKLTFLLQQAKSMEEPVLLHVITKKGKGYIPAETKPASFHGIGKFDPSTGLSRKTTSGQFSDTFGHALCRLAQEDANICAITAAMEQGTGLRAFASVFPERFFDVGIAEGHAICLAAGLAKQGMVPVFAVYSTFLQRGYDMLLHDISLLNLHVVFAVDRAGLVGEDGETHHGVFDAGFLSQIPGMQILAPSSQAELERLLRHAVRDMDGPVSIRYSKGTDGCYKDSIWQDHIMDDSQVTLVTYGTMINDSISAEQGLQADGIAIDLIKLDQIWPLDLKSIAASVGRTGRLIVVEETMDSACLGHRILSGLLQEAISPRVRLLNLGTQIPPHGTTEELRSLCQIDQEHIIKAVKELILHET